MVKFYVEEERDGTISLVNYVYDEDRYTEINNTDFDAKITVKDDYRGRSAGGVIVVVEGHPQVPVLEAHMSLMEFIRLVKLKDMRQGVFQHRMKFIKRGANCFVVGVDHNV